MVARLKLQYSPANQFGAVKAKHFARLLQCYATQRPQQSQLVARNPAGKTPHCWSGQPGISLRQNQSSVEQSLAGAVESPLGDLRMKSNKKGFCICDNTHVNMDFQRSHLKRVLLRSTTHENLALTQLTINVPQIHRKTYYSTQKNREPKLNNNALSVQVEAVEKLNFSSSS